MCTIAMATERFAQAKLLVLRLNLLIERESDLVERFKGCYEDKRQKESERSRGGKGKGTGRSSVRSGLIGILRAKKAS